MIQKVSLALHLALYWSGEGQTAWTGKTLGVPLNRENATEADALDEGNGATDQKVGGSSPSERAEQI